MGDLDCGDCDCGECSCGDCDCDCNCLDGDCGCNDCKCDCNECHPCDQFACGLCCGGCVNDTTENVMQVAYVDTGTDTYSNSSHTRGHRERKKREQRNKYMVPNGELNNEANNGLSNSPNNGLSNGVSQTENQVVITQPGTVAVVVVTQPRAEPPSYEDCVGKATP